MLISYSELSKFDTCRRQYYYNFVLNLQPVEVSEPIDTGLKGHKLLQIFYTALQEGMSKKEALDYVTEEAMKAIYVQGLPDSHLVTAWTLITNYIRENEFTAEAVLVENRFRFPLSKLSEDPDILDVEIGFTPDVVFKRTGDFYDVEDAKFIGRAWSSKKLEHFQQAKLYHIFLRRMGYPVSRSITRFFNTKTGKINYSVANMTAAEEAIIIRDFVAGVKELIRYKKQSPELLAQSRHTLNHSTCQYCFYAFPCNLETQGKDASSTLASLYVKRDYDYNS